ncbi:MAG: nuclear transport factor 2 family protein [Alphaproteobacteria bacterium]|nr:nuclear transport factor 2 family protein [Alphaproteobacteria bacterium]
MTENFLLDGTRRWAEAFASPMPEGIEPLLALAAPDIRFTDPFSDVTGREGLRAVLVDMSERCTQARFDILDVAASQRAGYIRWHFRFVPRGRDGKAWEFQGMSEILFADDRLVRHHLDHWDSASQLYARLPVLGWPVRRMRAALAVTTPPPE